MRPNKETWLFNCEGKCPPSAKDKDPTIEDVYTKIKVPYFDEEIPITLTYAAQVNHGNRVMGAKGDFFIAFTELNYQEEGKDLRDCVQVSYLPWNEGYINEMVAKERKFYYEVYIPRVRHLQRLLVKLKADLEKEFSDSLLEADVFFRN